MNTFLKILIFLRQLFVRPVMYLDKVIRIMKDSPPLLILMLLTKESLSIVNLLLISLIHSEKTGMADIF